MPNILDTIGLQNTRDINSLRSSLNTTRDQGLALQVNELANLRGIESATTAHGRKKGLADDAAAAKLFQSLKEISGRDRVSVTDSEARRAAARLGQGLPTSRSTPGEKTELANRDEANRIATGSLAFLNRRRGGARTPITGPRTLPDPFLPGVAPDFTLPGTGTNTVKSLLRPDAPVVEDTPIAESAAANANPALVSKLESEGTRKSTKFVNGQLVVDTDKSGSSVQATGKGASVAQDAQLVQDQAIADQVRKIGSSATKFNYAPDAQVHFLGNSAKGYRFSITQAGKKNDTLVIPHRFIDSVPSGPTVGPTPEAANALPATTPAPSGNGGLLDSIMNVLKQGTSNLQNSPEMPFFPRLPSNKPPSSGIIPLRPPNG